MNPFDIPIFIITYNRVKCLQLLIEWLESNKYSNIIIIDNHSRYEPLLEYLDTLPYTIESMPKNLGHEVIWRSGILSKYNPEYYVVTDPDILPIDTCPGDCIRHFKHLLDSYPKIQKVGFGLKIDDLPDHYKHKQDVIDWESRFWKKEIEPNVFLSAIDTTFALYRKNSSYMAINDISLRTGEPYIARHLPWYDDSNIITEEDEFYVKSKVAETGHWTGK